MKSIAVRAHCRRIGLRTWQGRQQREKIAVYDLGGGTFDISILELGEGVFEVKYTTRHPSRCDDLTRRSSTGSWTASRRGGRISRRTRWPCSGSRNCGEAKIDLSTLDTSINLPYITAMPQVRNTADESLLGTFRADGIDLVERSRKPCLNALKDAGLFRG